MLESNDNVGRAVPFFRVTVMACSLAFYVDGLGFQITRRWDVDGELRWCWLDWGGASLMLQTLGDDAPERLALSTLGAGVSVSFMSRDALAIYREALERG